MNLREALAVLREARRDDDVVITTMAPARDWMALAGSILHPLDLVLVPSAMGHASSIALGLALAQPRRRIVVCNGDGSLLMNLGSLVSITAAGPANLVHILCDNGVYEVTGAQPTPGGAKGREDRRTVDYIGIARGCGFRSLHRFGDIAKWRRAARDILDGAGPSFVLLDVETSPGVPGPRSPGPAGERSRRFRDALTATQPP